MIIGIYERQILFKLFRRIYEMDVDIYSMINLLEEHSLMIMISRLVLMMNNSNGLVYLVSL